MAGLYGIYFHLQQVWGNELLAHAKQSIQFVYIIKTFFNIFCGARFSHRGATLTYCEQKGMN